MVDENFRLNQPFVGIASFLRSQICNDIKSLNTGIAVMGVPTDEGSPLYGRLARRAAGASRALASLWARRRGLLRP